MQADGPETWYFLTVKGLLPRYLNEPSLSYPLTSTFVTTTITRDASSGILTLTSDDPALPDSPYTSSGVAQFLIPLGQITGCYQGKCPTTTPSSLSIFPDGHVEVYPNVFSVPILGFDYDPSDATHIYPAMIQSTSWTAPPQSFNIKIGYTIGSPGPVSFSPGQIGIFTAPANADKFNWWVVITPPDSTTQRDAQIALVTTTGAVVLQDRPFPICPGMNNTIYAGPLTPGSVYNMWWDGPGIETGYPLGIWSVQFVPMLP